MKKYMRVILALFFIINLVFITSCNKNHYNVAEIKAVFSKYSTNENVFIDSRGNLAFSTMEIDLYKLISNKEMIDSVGVYNEKIYFTATENKGAIFDKKTIFRIYSCNRDGSELKENYQNNTYSAYPTSLLVDEICYVNYRVDIKQRATDCYNLITGEYKHIETKDQGNGNVLAYYEKDSGYEINTKTVTQKETQDSLEITTQSIKDTICYQDIQKYDYFLGGINIYNEKIYITYYVEVSSGWWYGKYVMFVFSLDFSTEAFEYETMIYTENTDIGHYRIMSF